LGKLSDRLGRRPVLLACVLGSAIGYFIFGIGGALWVLFLSRLIDGFTGGNISTASAYLADVPPPENAPRISACWGWRSGLASSSVPRWAAYSVRSVSVLRRMQQD
jgi:DHA1 family tetracycline resistance protein-like MFS transporter